MAFKDPDAAREYLRQWRLDNPGKEQEYRLRYYERNKEKIAERTRRYREANAEHVREIGRRSYEKRREAALAQARQHYAENPEPVREKNRQWAAANPEKMREYGRRYREANTEKERQRLRQSRQKNRDRVLERERQYRARRGTGGRRVQAWALNHGLRPEDWAALWDAQDGRCYLCGKEMAPEQVHIDHDHRCCPKDHSCIYCRRGLAHASCNQLIGFADDDPDRLRSIADNLEVALKSGFRLR